MESSLILDDLEDVVKVIWGAENGWSKAVRDCHKEALCFEGAMIKLSEIPAIRSYDFVLLAGGSAGLPQNSYYLNKALPTLIKPESILLESGANMICGCGRHSF